MTLFSCCKLCSTVDDESSQWTMLTGSETILEQKLSITWCQIDRNERKDDLAASDTDEKRPGKHTTMRAKNMASKFDVIET